MTRTRRRATSVLVGIIVAALTACGGGGAKAVQSTSSSGRGTDQLAADKLLAATLVVNLRDLPDGWSSTPPKDSPDSPAETAAVEKFAACLGIDPSLLGDETPDDQKAKFKGDKLKFDRDQEIESSATVEDSAAVARTALEILGKTGASACFQDFFNSAIQAAVSSESEGTTFPAGVSIGDVDLQTVDLPLHTDAVVFRAGLPFSVRGIDVVGRFDFVFAVRDRVDLTFTFSNLGDPFPEDLEVQVINAVIDRTPTS